MKEYLREDLLYPDEKIAARIAGLKEFTLNYATNLCETIQQLQNAIKPRYVKKLHEDLEKAVSSVWDAIEKANKHLREKYELD